MKFTAIFLTSVIVCSVSAAIAANKTRSAIQEKISNALFKAFATGIDGNDFNQAKPEYKKQLKNLGINIERIDEYFGALEMLINAFNPDLPFKVESDEIEKLVRYYIYVSEEFVRCQPGLETFDTSSKLRSDSANDKFYEIYNQLSNISLYINNNPDKTHSFFDGKLAEMSANFILLTMEMSKRSLKV